MEQEHRDRELALRLAHEDQNQVEDLSRYVYRYWGTVCGVKFAAVAEP